MRSSILLFGIVALTMMGCRKDEPVPPVEEEGRTSWLTVTYAPFWEGVAFDKYAVYHDVLDHRVQVQGFKFYLAKARAKRPDGTWEDLFNVDLLDLLNGPKSRSYALPPGTYTDLEWGIGLPPDLNHTDPVTYPAEHPLGFAQGMWWSWADAYRFVIFDGRFDTDPNGTEVPPPGQFSIHTGLDTCYRAGQYDISGTTVPDSGYAHLEMRIDLAHFLYSASDTIDLQIDNQAHGGNVDLATRLSDNVRDAITVSTQ
ncbi:MAG: hypothetical protein H6595_01450 [Flavobacteriales bacterium]|nr:hypothetical protein [Flavobacteriales bacterium]MCB9166125.1 hypothetical protein [Flavobacteriales bacterium]